jgi:hypothetical protein
MPDPTNVCRRLLLVALVAISACQSAAPTASPSAARALLERSLAHHDPDGAWRRLPIAIHWTSSKPDGSTSFVVDIELDPGGAFSMSGERRGRELEYSVIDGVVWARVDGAEDFSDDVRAEMGLARDDGFFWRDYLGFLAGMPMCLTDPGVRIEADVLQTELEGQLVQSIRASFAADVGTDVWTFYFEPDTAALVGCRFDRADPSKDGETIVFEGSSSVDGLHLPRTRRWYMNADRRFLGTDELR